MKQMAPYLFANLLTVGFVYSHVMYARLERENREGSFEGILRIAVTLMILMFCGFGAYEWIKV